jgi:hypothetical protein
MIGVSTDATNQKSLVWPVRKAAAATAARRAREIFQQKNIRGSNPYNH